MCQYSEKNHKMIEFIDEDSFLKVLRNNIKVKLEEITLIEKFDDFEILFLDEINNASKFASKVSLINDNNFPNKVINILIKNGVFTDDTGYCHKIVIDEEIMLRLT